MVVPLPSAHAGEGCQRTPQGAATDPPRGYWVPLIARHPVRVWKSPAKAKAPAQVAGVEPGMETVESALAVPSARPGTRPVAVATAFWPFAITAGPDDPAASAVA